MDVIIDGIDSITHQYPWQWQARVPQSGGAVILSRLFCILITLQYRMHVLMTAKILPRPSA
jgi:hypothetical protein